MNTLFIKSLITIIDTKALSFSGVISADNFNTSLWEEALLSLTVTDKKLNFQTLYKKPFENFLNYSNITISIINCLGNTKLNESKNIYELYLLNDILKDIIIEDSDILEITLNSFILEKNIDKTIHEKSDLSSIFFIFSEDNMFPLSYLAYEEIQEALKNLSSIEKEISVSVCTHNLKEDILINEPETLAKAFITSKTIIPLDFYKNGKINIRLSSGFSENFALYLINSENCFFIDSFKFNESHTIDLPSNGVLLIETSINTIDFKTFSVNITPLSTKYREITTHVFSKNSFLLEGVATNPSITTKAVKTDYFNMLLLNSDKFNINSTTLENLVELALYNQLIL
ncbi:MAG: hypothetical protein ACRDAU_09345 [Clostridium sp.]